MQEARNTTRIITREQLEQLIARLLRDREAGLPPARDMGAA